MDKFFQFVELFNRLARVAHNKGGADGCIGEERAELAEQLEGSFAVDAALHGGEDAAVDVLQGNVDIVADVVVALHYLDGVDGERGGVGVVEANPLGTGFGGKPFEQLAEGAVAVEVETIVGCVL